MVTLIGSMLAGSVGLLILFAAAPVYGAAILLAVPGLAIGVGALRVSRGPAAAVWAIGLSALVLLYAGPMFARALQFYTDSAPTD